MKRFFSLGAPLACLIFSSLAPETLLDSAAFGQSAPAGTPRVTLIPRSHEERESRYQAEHRIILNVVVTDPAGRPVMGLKQEDFALLDSGKPQTVASFRAVEDGATVQPAHVILMLDTLNNSSRSIANDRRDMEKLLKQSQAHLTHPFSIAVLSDSGISLSQPSRDREDLLREFNRLTSHLHTIGCADEESPNQAFLGVWMPDATPASLSSNGLACLNQRFERSVSELNQLAKQQVNVPARIILIWIGPGWPLLLDKKFRPDTAEVRSNFFNYLVELSTTLREAQVTLDAVSSPDLFRHAELRSDHDNTFFDGVPKEDDVTAGSLGLQVLAHQSGGQILTQGKDLASEAAQCVSDSESYYVLSFDSHPAVQPGEFHSLQVKVDKPGLKVRTTTGYYAQP